MYELVDMKELTIGVSQGTGHERNRYYWTVRDHGHVVEEGEGYDPAHAFRNALAFVAQFKPQE